MAVLLRRLHIPCTHTVAASASLLIILMKEFLKSNGGWERQHTDIINLDCQKASVTVLFLSNLFLKPIKLGSKYFYMEDISYCYGPNPVWDWTGRINGQFPSWQRLSDYSIYITDCLIYLLVIRKSHEQRKSADEASYEAMAGNFSQITKFITSKGSWCCI